MKPEAATIDSRRPVQLHNHSSRFSAIDETRLPAVRLGMFSEFIYKQEYLLTGSLRTNNFKTSFEILKILSIKLITIATFTTEVWKKS